MYNCSECMERLYPFLDRELDSTERDEVRQHLNRCRGCSVRFRFEGNVLRYVGEIARSTHCPPEARKRILRACGRLAAD